MTTWITVCDTCKREDIGDGDTAYVAGPELAEKIEYSASLDPKLQVRRHSCLMGCKHGCNVAIQGIGKISYTLGDFLPDQIAADALVTFARLHAESETGQVPYRQWPEAVKGHFVTRHPPLPEG